MSLPVPFADDAASATLGGLTVENGRHRLALYGTLEVARDKAGLASVRAWAAFLAQAVAALEADPHLPDRLPPPAPPGTAPNPFA